VPSVRFRAMMTKRRFQFRNTYWVGGAGQSRDGSRLSTSSYHFLMRGKDAHANSTALNCYDRMEQSDSSRLSGPASLTLSPPILSSVPWIRISSSPAGLAIEPRCRKLFMLSRNAQAKGGGGAGMAQRALVALPPGWAGSNAGEGGTGR
jgi:hypothetical protein